MLQLVQKLTQLGHFQHLYRERAQNELKAWPFTWAETQKVSDELQMCIQIFNLMFVSSRWEDRFGAIHGSCLVLERMMKDAKSDDAQAHQDLQAVSTAMKAYMWDTILKDKYKGLLLDSEFRVRNAAGTLLKTTMQSDMTRALSTFDEMKALLLQDIESTF